MYFLEWFFRNHVFFLIPILYPAKLTMLLQSGRAKQKPIRTWVAADINGIVGVCRGGLGVWTFGTNCIPIHNQSQAVFAFLSLKCVPSPVAQSAGSWRFVRGGYPPGTIVNVKQDLNKQDTGKYLGESFHI